MRLRYWLAAACVLVWAQAAVAASLIALSGNSFKLAGHPELAGVSPAEYSTLFRVGVDGPNFSPMTGGYRLYRGELIFTPTYPLVPGLTYRAEFRRGGQSDSNLFAIPKAASSPSTIVSSVTPSGTLVPENLLKLYVHFSAPMSKGDVYGHIHLLDQSGKEVNSVFLQIGQELWDLQQTRLTLLFDPGRIKRGLVSLAQLGMALKSGRHYTLVIDQNWPDAKGQPLKTAYRKTFSVGPADRVALDPDKWKISAPKSGTRQGVTIDFHEALDEVLLQDRLNVLDQSGKPVAGSVTVDKNGSRWTFVPAANWQAGNYQIAVPSILEDLAGNKIHSPFDVDVIKNPEQRMVFKTYSLKFVTR